MYVIRVNEEHWLVGIWRGWLALSRNPSRALVYRSLSSAANAVSYYNEVAPGRDYNIHEISRDRGLFPT